MKINSVQPSGGVESYKKLSAKQAAESASGELSDRVELSFEAKNFASVFNAVKDGMDGRNAEEKSHIADVAAQVQSGTYKISSEDIADRILGGSVDIEA